MTTVELSKLEKRGAKSPKGGRLVLVGTNSILIEAVVGLSVVFNKNPSTVCRAPCADILPLPQLEEALFMVSLRHLDL